MPRPALFRRRSVPLPTVWGWLLLLALGSAAGLLGLRHAHAFLSPESPSGAELLVVEGWLDSGGLDQAVELVRAGGYRRVVTSGGPITSWSDLLGFSTHAELAADYLVRNGLPAGAVVAVPAPASAQDRTFLSAVEVREWLAREGLTPERIDVLSLGCHARRTWLLYRMAFGPQVQVGILAAQPSQYDPGRWWRTSVGAKAVASELLALLWTELCFWPGPPGSVEERWAVPAGGG